MRKTIILIAAAAALLSPLPLSAQDVLKKATPERRSHAWELGIGGSAMNYTRNYVSDFRRNEDGSYLFHMENKAVYGGVNAYAAFELLKWLYVDAQGTYGLARYLEKGAEKQGRSVTGGLGIQIRPFTRSEWIQPYLRAGINYYRKDFRTSYFGKFDNDPTGEAEWAAEDAWNKTRREDFNSMVPVSVGAGVIGWVSNRVGVRLQADYLMPVAKGRGVNFAQGTVGLVVRLGGADKRKRTADWYVYENPADYYDYFAGKIPPKVVEKVKEVPVEKEVVREVVREAPSGKTLAELMDNVTFDFNRYTLTGESQLVLDEVARVLKHFPDTRFMVAGYTDARGGAEYNDRLSANRAQAVYEALLDRGIPKTQIVCRGFGKRVAIVPASASDLQRRGDRKVVIERITNDELWQYLTK